MMQSARSRTPSLTAMSSMARLSGRELPQSSRYRGRRRNLCVAATNLCGFSRDSATTILFSGLASKARRATKCPGSGGGGSCGWLAKRRCLNKTVSPENLGSARRGGVLPVSILAQWARAGSGTASFSQVFRSATSETRSVWRRSGRDQLRPRRTASRVRSGW